MPIKVACKCGKAFAARDQLAGKTVKCPQCGNPLKIPASQAAASGKSSAAPNRAAASKPSKPTSSPGAGVGDLLDEAGVEARVGMKCPGCGEKLPQNAVLCVHCGYNFQLGRQMLPDDPSLSPQQRRAAIHGNPLLDKAEYEMTSEKKEKKKNPGLPWWAILLLLMMVIGFAAGMMLLPADKVFLVSGAIALGLGFLIGMVCGIWILVIAFSESVACGLMSMFVPFYGLYYIVTRWEQCGAPFLISLGGNAMWGLGYALVFFAPMLEG